MHSPDPLVNGTPRVCNMVAPSPAPSPLWKEAVAASVMGLGYVLWFLSMAMGMYYALQKYYYRPGGSRSPG